MKHKNKKVIRMRKPYKISYPFLLCLLLLFGGLKYFTKRADAFSPPTAKQLRHGLLLRNLKLKQCIHAPKRSHYSDGSARQIHSGKRIISTIVKSSSFDDVIHLTSLNSNFPTNEGGADPETDSLLSSSASSPPSSVSSQDSSNASAYASASSTTTMTQNRSVSLKSSSSVSTQRIDTNNNNKESVGDFSKDTNLKEGKQDSFRPSKEPLEPFIINLLIKIFETGEDAERIVNKSLRARRRRYSKDLTLDDCNIIRKRVFGTVALQLRLNYILEKVVEKSGTLEQKFGFKLGDFGLSVSAIDEEDQSGDPLQLLHKAECLLATYMLTEEKDSKVEFLESDRLDILVKNLDLEEIESDEFYKDIKDDVERISKRRSMPTWIVKRYIEEFGFDGTDSLCNALNMPTKTVVRINPEKSSRQKIARALVDSNNPVNMDLQFLQKAAARDPAVQQGKYNLPLQFQSANVNNLGSSQRNEIDEANKEEEKIEATKGTIFESLISRSEESTSPAESEKISIMETKYSPWGLILENRRVPLTSLEIYQRGWIDIMNEASQCSVLASGAKPWDIVLIYGSKTGVKAHAIASLMRENGMVYCYEEYERQVHQLKSRIERFGTSEIMEIIPDVNDARRIRADVVFVDAICSNSGVLNHHPSMRYRKKEEDIAEKFIPKQKEMLKNAATSVAPGGLLVYTTCSLFREENQDIADWFINSEFGADFEPEAFDEKGHMRLFAPHIHGSTMDGTFLCRWRRKQLPE